MTKSINLALVGASGVVGTKIIQLLEKKGLAIDNFYPLGNASAGQKLEFNSSEYTINNIDSFDPSKADLTIFSAGSEVAKKYGKAYVEAGSYVIDLSSHFRYEEDVPLVIPEINGAELETLNTPSLIANPNCSTIQMLVALKPIHDRFKILNINVSTYQAVSGSGKSGIDELLQQSHNYLNQQKIKSSVYPKQIGFNAIPFVDSFCDNGYTKEEMKIVWETQKILDKDITVNATAVRVPVLVGHSESVTIQTDKPIDIQKIRDDYSSQKGIRLMDNPDSNEYPTAFENGHGTDDVYVGRIRKSLDSEKVLNIWVVADNVRKGAALNSIQIAEELIKAEK